MHGASSTRASAVRYYLVATAPLAKQLAVMFEVCFPREYQNYKAAVDAGVWHAEDPGPWLVRAIIWKMQVDPHVDGLDGLCPTASFPMGNYIGAPMYLTDLRAKLA
jgi:hypothetical protein